MQKIFIIFSLFFTTFIHAATVTTNQAIYTPTDGVAIEVNFEGMVNKNKDWIALYHSGASNAWGNVIAWKWTGDKSSGKVTLLDASQRHKIQDGKYEVRAFYNNSYKLEAKVAFEVKGANPRAPKLHIKKTEYSTTEKIAVAFEDMANKNKDWIAVYPANASNAWENVVDWAWTKDKTSGQLSFDALPEGDYEIRAFYNNSASVVYARVSFKVKIINTRKAKLSTTREYFKPTEDVRINFENIKGSTEDWIGIYHVGSQSNRANAIQWKSNKGSVTKGQANFGKLANGNYEARLFYDDSHEGTYKDEASVEFSVHNLFEEAKEQCLVKGKSTALILCSPDTQEAYILDNSKLFISTLHIADLDRGLRLGKSIASIDKPSPHNTYVGFRILENTPLIAIDVSYDMGDLIDVTTFYNVFGKVQFSTGMYQGHNDYTTLRGTIKTIENGQKLRITYKGFDHDRNEWINYQDIYDISNINDIKKISQTEI